LIYNFGYSTGEIARFVRSKKTIAKRTMPNIIATAFISDSIAYLTSSGAELAAQVGLS